MFNFLHYLLPLVCIVRRKVIFSQVSVWSQGVAPASGPRSFPRGYPNLWLKVLSQGRVPPSLVTGPVQNPVPGPARGYPSLWSQVLSRKEEGVAQSGHRIGVLPLPNRTRTGDLSPSQTGPGQRHPPPQAANTMDRICCWQYASCGHRGRLSCYHQYLKDNRR